MFGHFTTMYERVERIETDTLLCRLNASQMYL